MWISPSLASVSEGVYERNVQFNVISIYWDFGGPLFIQRGLRLCLSMAFVDSYTEALFGQRTAFTTLFYLIIFSHVENPSPVGQLGNTAWAHLGMCE